MTIYLKASAGILIALICYLTLLRQSKDISLLLSIAVCATVAISAIQYIAPIVDFIESLKDLGDIDNQMFRILLRASGIGLLAEITSLLCIDAGNSAMAKTLQILAGAVILWLSIPLFTAMIQLIKEILLTI